MLVSFNMGEDKMYPEYIEINNKQHKINTDFKVALACFEALQDDEINDVARMNAVISLLLGIEKEGNIEVPQFNNEDSNKAMELLIKYLSCNDEEPTNVNTKRDMDFIQDKEYIYSSFLTDYQIDLENTQMHWWKFCNLLKGLTDKCILSRIRDIRNTDLSEYKDAKTKEKIIKVMESVKLKEKKTKEQQDAIDEFNNLFK